MSVSNVADQQDHKEEFFTSNALLVCGQFITITFLSNE